MLMEGYHMQDRSGAVNRALQMMDRAEFILKSEKITQRDIAMLAEATHILSAVVSNLNWLLSLSLRDDSS